MHENNLLKNNPIGIFDSGFGGLTVMSAISKLMPKEDIIYFGDSAHVPYGSKSKKVVTDFAVKISKFLIKNNVKIIVIACNTASAFSLNTLKKIVNIPVIGVIKPGSVSAINNTKNNKIGEMVSINELGQEVCGINGISKITTQKTQKDGSVTTINGLSFIVLNDIYPEIATASTSDFQLEPFMFPYYHDIKAIGNHIKVINRHANATIEY